MKKLKDFFWIGLPIALMVYLVYKIAMNSFTDHFLGNNPQIVKAAIIGKKNYLPNQPVRAEFSYSYSFTVNGKEYTGNSHDISLKIGDSVEIKYNKDYPDINKPLHPKE